QRINHGIESAHNFAYVMAPWCMSSPYCLIELEYARLLGKRVIPINHKAPSKTEERPLSASIQQILVDFYKFYHLPPQNIQTNKDVIKRSRILVGKSNWLAGQEKISDEDCKNLVEWAKVYENNWTKHDDLAHLKTVKLPLFGETVDAIEGVIERITAVLDRQIDYVHQHTEVLAEALHWQKNQKASVHLLVGKERISAEDWLLTDFLPPKQPPSQPSTLVCEFICESRKNVENLMTDIFICYDRYDQTIRDNVIQSLSRHAKTTWAHDRDIQKGADYQREIEVGIENADNFFYFISPHAVVSEYCQAELKHAIQYNKRIIPLLIIPTEEAAVPESLRGLQYIDFTDNTCQADYDSDIDDILNILRQDQEYYKQHKILLARALKWAAENQKPSFLLSGHNLENAKTWWRLHEKREQHPPLPVHQELIAASEAAKGQLSTEVFISYSRKDSDFARQLNMSLQEAGKTTWFDQESISSGVDFENEIFKGISGADNFLFVLSPDAVESEYCENEVNYAVSQNKRFISVLHREVDSGTLPEKLQKLHWIDFKDKAFEQSFPELVQTIELDREHAHQHTLLQQRATDWSENRQCSDFLLNTAACYDAEQWLRTTENKQPEPTALQRDFIQQSRKAIVFAESAVAKRRKITFTTITTGMIFAVFLAVFAVIQMNTANENLQFAKARLYHAKAQVLKATDAPIALRLAEKSRELDPLNESIDRTLQDIYAHGELDLSALPYGNGTVLPNGKRNNLLLATGKVGTEPIAIDVEGQQVVKDIASEWDISEPLLFSLNGHKKWVSHAAFSPDGSKIVTASGDATAKIWDRKGNLLTTLVGHQKVKISEIEGQEDRNL
ncbi:MAG: TIR domain-containing protein, partial [Thiomargarita sp.]|nr:TIR domain-containing protein [Thiomargarita sp.]